jgi:tetratricopeptide (TPR) repeat protein
MLIYTWEGFMRLFIYICISFCSLIYSSENESLGDKKAVEFLTATELESLKAMIPENLRYEIPEIPNNSFLDLQEFLKDKEAPRFSDQDRQTIQNIEDFKKVSSKELRDLTNTLDKQKILFDQFQLHLKDRPHILVPLEPTFLSFDLAHFRAAIQYLNVKVLISYRKKEFDDAVKYLQKAVFLIQKLENRKGSLIDQLVVLACKGMTYHRINWILRHKNQSFKNITELEKILESLQSPLDLWDDTVKYEMFFSLKMFELTPVDLGPELMDETLKEFNEEVSKISDKDLTAEGVTRKELKDFAEDAKELSRMSNIHELMFKEYLGGSIAFLLDLKVHPLKEYKNLEKHLRKREKLTNQHLKQLVISPIYWTILRKIAEKENHRQAILLILAIRKYQLKYKRAPKNFKDMIAGAVLSEIPKDMWTGKNLKVNIKQRYIEFDATQKGKTKKCYF